MPHPDPTTAALWLDPEQGALLAAITRDLGLRVLGVGSPALGRAPELAPTFTSDAREPAPLDDLRQSLSAAEGQVFVLASVGEFGRERVGPGGGDSSRAAAADDAAVLAARHSRAGDVVVTFEPLPASVLDLEVASPAGGATTAEQAGVVLGQQPTLAPATATGARGGEWAAFVPLFRSCPSFRSAAEVLAHLGPIHTLAVECCSALGEGSLGARLFDAVDFATNLLGEPDSVDAAYVWPGRGKVVHPMPGDSLHGLRGAMTANLRFADGRAASLVCADGSVGAGRWSRRATIIGEGGRLRIGDSGFEFVSADGQSIDRSRGWAAEQDGLPAAAVFAAAIKQLIDPHTAGLRDLPIDRARVLSVSGAALLSARTGEPESPATILRMAKSA